MDNRTRHRIRYGAAAAALCGIIFVVRKEYSLLGISDAFAVAGLVFMILALFRTAKYMRFYDLPIYGFKKFMEIWKLKEPNRKNSQIGDYGDFLETYEHEKNYAEAYLCAGALLLTSLILSIFL